jgi:transcriptional regulator with XRE-family HTH domain
MEIHTNGDDCLIPDNRKRDTAFMRRVLAANLLSIRKVRNMSQEGMEEATGVSTNEIGKIEREETSAGLDTITALALGLGLEVKQLLDLDMDAAAVSLNRNGGSE